MYIASWERDTINNCILYTCALKGIYSYLILLYSLVLVY